MKGQVRTTSAAYNKIKEVWQGIFIACCIAFLLVRCKMPARSNFTDTGTMIPRNRKWTALDGADVTVYIFTLP